MNKKKAANYIQDLGALIALVLLIVVIGAISPEFRTAELLITASTVFY